MLELHIDRGPGKALLFLLSTPKKGMKEDKVVISTDERRLQKCEVQLISFCSRLDCNLNQVLSLDTEMLVPCWNLLMAGPQYRVQNPAETATLNLSAFPGPTFFRQINAEFRELWLLIQSV